MGRVRGVGAQQAKQILQRTEWPASVVSHLLHLAVRLASEPSTVDPNDVELHAALQG